MVHFKQMRIRKRLHTGFVIISTVASLAAMVGCVAMVVVAKRYESALENYGFSQGDVGKAMVAFADARSATRAVVGYGDKDAIEHVVKIHDEKRVEFEEYMEKIKGELMNRQEQELYDNVVNILEDYWNMDYLAMTLGKSSVDVEQSKKAQKMAAEYLDPIYDETYNNLVALMDVKVKAGNQLSNSLRILYVSLIFVIIIIIIVAFVGSMKIGILIADGIAVPMEQLSDRLKTFAEGDLDAPFPEVVAQDEVAEMVADAKDMADNLNLIIADCGDLLEKMAEGNYAISTRIEDKYVGGFTVLKDATSRMNGQINEILHNIVIMANQVSEGSGNLSEAAYELAEGAKDQTDSVENLQTTMEHITKGVRTTAESVEESYRQSELYANDADSSLGEMKAMMDAMKKINMTSQKIGSIISEIEDIASETNLLSLNASIEAARAGQSGRGFAVLAVEIGKLAEQSAKSAVDSRKLIESAIMEIEEGNVVANQVAESIARVANGMKEVAESSRNLSMIIHEQAEEMEEAKNGVNEITKVIRSNSQTAVDTSATSAELSAQATSMREMVSRFVLKSEIESEVSDDSEEEGADAAIMQSYADGLQNSWQEVI